MEERVVSARGIHVIDRFRGQLKLGPFGQWKLIYVMVLATWSSKKGEGAKGLFIISWKAIMQHILFTGNKGRR